MGSLLHRYRNILILSLLLIYALMQIFSVRLQNRYALNIGERLIMNLTSPPQEFLTYIIDRTHTFWLDYIYLVDTRKTYRQMAQQNRNLNLKIALFEEEHQENLRLHQLLGFKEKTRLNMLPARVISFGSSSFTHSVRINKGESEGVLPGMSVVTAEGVVGHVINATAHFANVLLLLDPNSSIDVVDQETRVRGILTGLGTHELRIEYVVKDANLKVGSRLVSSGLDTVYPKGLVVGSVSDRKVDKSKLFVEAYVEPAVNFSKLEEVLIISGKTQTLEPIDTIDTIDTVEETIAPQEALQTSEAPQ